MTAATRVLAIHAHPDDVEFLCAGTLARLRQLGCEIVIATMTAGDCGSAELSQAEISKVRRAEARRAADLLAAEYHCLEFEDLCITHDVAGRRKVTEVVRRARADLVLTSAPVDYMSDHEMTSRLVRDACFAASVPNYSTHQWDPAPVLPRIPHLYYMDPIEGIDLFGRTVERGFVIDITDTMPLKLEMLACHASQRDWLLRQHGIDEYLESCKHWSRHCGESIGVAYGEGFTQHRGHAYPQTDLLRGLLA